MSKIYDLSKCMINIEEVKPGQRMVEAFPILYNFPEFKRVQQDKFIKIAILISDFKSPFIRIKDPKIKVESVFDFLELGLNTKSAQKEFEDIYLFRHETVIDCCCRYIQMQNEHEFSSWWSQNLLYYELQRENSKPRGKDEDINVYTNRKIRIDESLEKIGKKLQEKESILFGDASMKKAIALSLLNKIKTYPEMLAMEDTIE